MWIYRRKDLGFLKKNVPKTSANEYLKKYFCFQEFKIN